MSELDPVHDALERLEWAEGKQEETPVTKWRAVTRRTALTGGAAGIAAAMLGACGSSSNNGKATATASAQESSENVFGSEGKPKVRPRQPRDDEPVLRACSTSRWPRWAPRRAR